MAIREKATLSRIKIIGCGFSGLSTAFWLVRAGFKNITLVDRTPENVGGMIATHRPSIDLGLVETAANAFMGSADIFEMSESIGVPLLTTRRDSRRRLIWRNGRVHQWPLSLGESFKAIVKLGRHMTQLKPDRHESLHLWGERLLGKAVADFLVSPAFQGVYGVTADQLNASLFMASRKSSRGNKGAAKVKGSVSPPQGMGQFMNGLRKFLETAGCEFQLERNIDDLEDFKRSRTEAVIVATSLSDASVLLSRLDPKLSAEMSKLPVTGLTSITAFFKAEERFQRFAGQKFSGGAFGCLFPRNQGIEALGVLFNNSIFDQRGPALSETWIYGQAQGSLMGKLPPSTQPLTEEEYRVKLLTDRRIFTGGRGSTPLHLEVSSWPRALPLYSWQLRNFLEARPFDKFKEKNIFFIGNYLGFIGLSKIASLAKLLANEIIANQIVERNV